MLVTKNEFMGVFAMWMVRQSPYDFPETLCTCLSEISDYLGKQVKSVDIQGFTLYDFHTAADLSSFVDKTIGACPSVISLNDRKREPTAQERMEIGFFDPDTDFIDLTALRMNIVRSLQAEDSQHVKVEDVLPSEHLIPSESENKNEIQN